MRGARSRWGTFALGLLLIGCGGQLPPAAPMAPVTPVASTPPSRPAAAAEEPAGYVTTIEHVRYEIWARPKMIPAPAAYSDKPGYGMDIRLRISSVDGATHLFRGYTDEPVLFLGQKRTFDGGELGSGGEGVSGDAPVVTTLSPDRPIVVTREIPNAPALDPVARGEGMEVTLFLMSGTPTPHHIWLARIIMRIPSSGPPELRIEPDTKNRGIDRATAAPHSVKVRALLLVGGATTGAGRSPPHEDARRKRRGAHGALLYRRQRCEPERCW